MDQPRVLICGSRRWPWPETVHTVLDRLATRHGDQLVVIEGAATGADRAAHRWCTRQQLPAWRHRCYPTAWNAERQRRPNTWQLTGPERNLHMLLGEGSHLVVAFHEHLLHHRQRGRPDDGVHLATRAVRAEDRETKEPRR